MSMLDPFRLFAVTSLILAGVLPPAQAEAPLQLPPVLLQMIRDSSVHEDLKLSAAQITQVRKSLSEVDGKWWLSRQLPADTQAKAIDELTQAMESKLSVILEPAQKNRLRELQLQAIGTRMVLRPDVASELKLSDAVRQQLVAVFRETDEASTKLNAKLTAGEIDAAKANSQLEQLKASERERLVKALTDEQRVKISKLSGTPFNFGNVVRTLPLAPELQTAGVTWIQGGPLQMANLRGKVVALHFYAFQCINCQRNFPHYKAWHKDFADKGLVVIGIQRPETAAEHDLSRVKAAAASDGFRFPVAMDANSSNWDVWGNTMWPTVYLIDKQGFIRRWWQGELNWQGGNGEEQLRKTIESLLNESS